MLQLSQKYRSKVSQNSIIWAESPISTQLKATPWEYR